MSGDHSLHYRCPHCDAPLTAERNTIGKQSSCTACGQTVKVPGADAVKTPRNEPSPSESTYEKATIAIICRCCGTRLYGKRSQIGQSIICPDCLETVEVPEVASATNDAGDASADKIPVDDIPVDDIPVDDIPVDDIDDGGELRLQDLDDDELMPSKESAGAAVRTGGENTAADSAAVPNARDDGEPDDGEPDDGEPDDGELRLAAEDGPAPASILGLDRILNAELRAGALSSTAEDRPDDNAGGDQEPGDPSGKDADLVFNEPRSDLSVDQVADPPPEPARRTEFGVKCITCDTRFYAGVHEIGTTKRCPDCFSEVPITEPPPERVQDSPADDDGETFRLSEPEAQTVHEDYVRRAESQTMGDQALKNARRDREERDRETVELPTQPLLQGVVTFLIDPAGFARLVFVGLWIALQVGLISNALIFRQAEGAAAMFGSIVCFVLSAMMMVFGGVTTSVVLLAIVQDSSNGEDRIENWPGVNFMDWLPDSLYMIGGLVFSAAPGMLLFWLFGCLGVPVSYGFWFVPISCYVLFPYVFLSILESDSVVTPVSTVVLNSMQQNLPGWIVFYGWATGLAVVLAITGALTDWLFQMTQFVLVPMGLVASLSLMLYFRVLGRLVWWSDKVMTDRQVAEEESKSEDDEEDDSESLPA